MNIKYPVRYNTPQNTFHFNVLNETLRYWVPYKIAIYIISPESRVQGLKGT